MSRARGEATDLAPQTYSPEMNRRRFRPALASFALVFALLPLPSALATAGPEFSTPEGGVRLVSGWATAPAGGDARLGVAFTLAPRWHVYWKNPGDAGYPPELTFAAGGPIEGGTLRYPAPSRYELPGGLVALGYEKEVIYPIDAQISRNAAGSARIAAALDYLVCAEICIPYAAELAFELAIGAPAEDPELAPRIAAWRARLPRPAAELDRVEARLERAEGAALELELTLAGAGLRAAAPDLFFEIHPLVAFDRPRFAARAGGPGFAVLLRPLDQTQPLPDRLAIAWTATGFERDGVPAAFEGTVDLERPVSPLASGGSLPLLLLASALVLAAALVYVQRRGRTSTATPRR